jgi:hypothetical protein
MTSEPLAPATREGVPVAWPEVPPGDVRTPLEVGLCAVCGRPLTGRRPQRVCSPGVASSAGVCGAPMSPPPRSPGSAPRTRPSGSGLASSSAWSVSSSSASGPRRSAAAASRGRRRSRRGRRRTLAHYSGCSVRWLRDRPRRPPPSAHYRPYGKVLVRRSDWDHWLAHYRQVGRPDVARVVTEVLGSLAR